MTLINTQKKLVYTALLSVSLLSSCKKEKIDVSNPNSTTETPNQSGKIKTTYYDNDSSNQTTYEYDAQGRVKKVVTKELISAYFYSPNLLTIKHFVVGDNEYVTESIPLNNQGYRLKDKNGSTYGYNQNGQLISFSSSINQSTGIYTWENGNLIKYEENSNVKIAGDTSFVSIYSYAYFNSPLKDNRNDLGALTGVKSTHLLDSIVLTFTNYYKYPNGTESDHITDKVKVKMHTYTFDSNGKVKSDHVDDFLNEFSYTTTYSYYE